MKQCNTTGAATNDGYPEHAFNWDVALRIRDALNQMGARTQMSRDDDDSVGPLTGNTSTQDRVTGFKQAIAGSRLNVVAELSAASDRAQGRSVTADILQRHPDLTMIFAANDEMALGAVEAVAAVGKTGQIQIIGFDGTKDAVAAIQAGTMAASVAQNPYKMGEVSVQEAIKAAKGQGSKSASTPARPW
jgi:ABC-type sugar transport system substrate-binding protein